MPAPVAAAPVATDTLRHESFCLPRPELTAPRIEGFVHYIDDPASGRSRPSHNVKRCLECGAADYQPIGA